MDVRGGLERNLSAKELMRSNGGSEEESFQSPLDCKEKQSILKEIKPEYSLEVLVLKLKLQYLAI